MPPDAVRNADQIAYWNETAGRTWAELQDDLDRQIEPLGAAAIAALAPAPGERILDVGCGCGQSSLILAGRVGPSGEVVGVDISAPMLAIARERAAGNARVSFLEADAQVYPFEAGAFDAIYSRFGVMFFEDPTAAFSNLRRTLRPGGRLSFLCWRAMSENPIMILPMAAAASHFPPQPAPEPGRPGPFALADADRVRQILTGAGFSGISIQPQDRLGGANTIEVATNLALRIGPLGALLREHPQALPRVIQDVRRALEAHEVGGRVALPSATWIVSARNP